MFSGSVARYNAIQSCTIIITIGKIGSQGPNLAPKSYPLNFTPFTQPSTTESCRLTFSHLLPSPIGRIMPVVYRSIGNAVICAMIIKTLLCHAAPMNGNNLPPSLVSHHSQHSKSLPWHYTHANEIYEQGEVFQSIFRVDTTLISLLQGTSRPITTQTSLGILKRQQQVIIRLIEVLQLAPYQQLLLHKKDMAGILLGRKSPTDFR